MSDATHSQNYIGTQNSEFWNELCGTNAAKVLGIDEQTSDSLRRFDKWFFDFYPYLIPFIQKNSRNCSSFLEVGLGYGSLGQFLATDKGSYTGLDIAKNAVEMMKFRIEGLQRIPTVIHSDVLNCPFEDNSFDCAVAIGSLHHTGNFNQAISELSRVVVHDGKVVGMVYSYFSLRNWILYPRKTLILSVKNFRNPVRVQADQTMRWLSDHNQKGDAAPSTEYFSRRSLRKVLMEYGDVKIIGKNFDCPPIPFGVGEFIRQVLIRTPLGYFLGLDLYFVLNMRKTY